MSQSVYIHGTDSAEQERLAKLSEFTNDAFIQFLEFQPTSAVLDVGCGLGILTRRLAKIVPGGTIWGVERSAEQLGKAVCDLPNLHFKQSDAQSLPFDDQTFDVVFCRYVLEHVANPHLVVKEMHRVLRPGGKIFAQENNILINIFYPDCPQFDALWQQFVRLQSIHGGDALIGKKLLGLLRDAGFADIHLSIQPEIHYQGMPTFQWWVENLWQNVRPSETQLIERGMATIEDIRNARADLDRLLLDPSGSAFFYWNRAKAIKPI